MWIDLNGDRVFAPSGAEFVDNHWGDQHALQQGPETVTVPPGVYRFRIQYYQAFFGAMMELVVRRLLLPLGTASGREFFLTSGPVTIDSARVLARETAVQRSARCFLATDDSRELHSWLTARTPNYPTWIGLSDEID